MNCPGSGRSAHIAKGRWGTFSDAQTGHIVGIVRSNKRPKSWKRRWWIAWLVFICACTQANGHEWTGGNNSWQERTVKRGLSGRAGLGGEALIEKGAILSFV